MSPQRIQLSRQHGWRLPAGAVNVARPTRWGNPFKVDVNLDAAAAVQLYIRALHRGDLPFSTADVVENLRGRDLACWCPPGQRCHADVLLAIANGPA